MERGFSYRGSPPHFAGTFVAVGVHVSDVLLLVPRVARRRGFVDDFESDERLLFDWLLARDVDDVQR